MLCFCVRACVCLNQAGKGSNWGCPAVLMFTIYIWSTTPLSIYMEYHTTSFKFLMLMECMRWWLEQERVFSGSGSVWSGGTVPAPAKFKHVSVTMTTLCS